MSDLKACPFCGRIPDIEDCGEHRWFIRCKCGIAQDKLFFQKCDAVRAWNKRKDLRAKDTNVPIKDTISRQEAIGALHDEIVRRRISEDTNDDGTLDEFDTETILRRLPSAEPTDEDVKEYCRKRCLVLITYDLFHKMTSAEPRMKGRWMEAAEPHWIPVTERMPDNEQPILFSTTTGRVHIGRYNKDASINQWYSSLDKMRAFNNVVNAWMPLPEPYEGEKDE